MAITRIVNESDMKGRYKLSLPSIEDDFTELTAKTEYQVLIDLFGASLYNTFDDDETAAIWTNLLNGVDGYTDYNGNTRNWQGLKQMIVPLLYSQYILLEVHSITGVIQPDNENSLPLSKSRIKNISNEAYNEFLKEYYNAYDYLYSNYSSYSNFDLYFKPKFPKSNIISATVR